MIKNKKIAYILIGIIIVVGIILDLVTKIYFENYFEDNSKNIEVIPNFFIFTFVKNTGAAYGMFSGSTIPLIVISILMIIAFVIYDIFNHSNDMLYILGFAFIISGAIGNLIDRIALGYVRDFISIKLFNFIFNVADIFVTIGMILFVVYLIKSMIQQEKDKKLKVQNNDLDK